MKKLLLIGIVALAALGLRASSVSWSLGSAVQSGSVVESVDNLRVWCFFGSDSSEASKVLTQAAAVSLIESGNFSGLKNYASQTGLTSNGGLYSNVSYQTDAFGSGVRVDCYAIIFDVSDKNLEGVAHYMLTDVNTITFSNGSQNRTATLTPSQEWVSIPEPTSGLLVMLGIAGLALRRRRS